MSGVARRTPILGWSPGDWDTGVPVVSGGNDARIALRVVNEAIVPPTQVRRLNIGCGNQHMDGWINIDAVKTPAADLVRDLTRGLPFEDSSVDEILADNVLEHIGPDADFIFVLNELHRVLRPGGVLTIIVPDGRSQAAWQDPTHKRAFVPRSALYWNQDLQWAKLYGITADFDVRVAAYGDMANEAFLHFNCVKREIG